MKPTRRTFLKNAVLGTAGTLVIPTILPSRVFGSQAPSNRINVAVIGCGRQSVAPNIPQLLASKHAQVVGVCDVDSTCISHGQKLVEAIKRYKVITRNDSEFRTLPKVSRAVELVRNGRIGKIQKICVGVPPELNGSALPPQPTMPVPAELNYDMWLGPAWEVPYTEKRAHAQKAYGRPGWLRVDSYCNGMISNWGAHLMGVAQWGNNSEYTGPVSIQGTGEFDQGLWNTLNRFDIRYEYADGVELFFKIERPYVRFEGSEGWIEFEYPDKLTASSPAILDSHIGADEMQIRDLPSDKEDFLLSIKAGKQTLEPLETAHRTITMCQLGLISIKTGSKLKWDPETEEIIGDNAASALLDIPIREKYFKF
jgi:hypothetical protein